MTGAKCVNSTAPCDAAGLVCHLAKMHYSVTPCSTLHTFCQVLFAWQRRLTPWLRVTGYESQQLSNACCADS